MQVGVGSRSRTPCSEVECILGPCSEARDAGGRKLEGVERGVQWSGTLFGGTRCRWVEGGGSRVWCSVVMGALFNRREAEVMWASSAVDSPCCSAVRHMQLVLRAPCWSGKEDATRARHAFCKPGKGGAWPGGRSIGGAVAGRIRADSTMWI